MAQLGNSDEPVVLGEEAGNVRLITLNRPRYLNVISPEMVSLLAGYLENWEKDDNVELIIIKGAGRAFSTGGDLRVFYAGKKSKDSCLKVVYRMYWLCYHIHTYKKTQQEERKKIEESKAPDDVRSRAEEVMKSKELQDKEIGKFVAEREQLIQNHKDKQTEMKKRHWEEELELEKEFDAALTKIMAKYAPDGAAIAFANA